MTIKELTEKCDNRLTSYELHVTKQVADKPLKQYSTSCIKIGLNDLISTYGNCEVHSFIILKTALVIEIMESSTKKPYEDVMKLDEKRYFHFKKLGYADADIQEIIDDYDVETINKGYAVSDFDRTGLLQIEAIGDVDAFESDEDAAKKAEADGVKLIPVCELPENFDRRYLGWIDTPENRKAIANYCAVSTNYYCNGNSLN